MPTTWKDALNSTSFKLYLVSCIISLVGFSIFLPGYFNNIIQPKPGIQLNDWFMNLFNPRDWSNEIFIIIFAAPILFFTTNYKNPAITLLSLQCYVTVNYFRIVAIYLFTLEAPEGLIVLSDPILSKVAYGGNDLFVKDFFFSGHTSTLALLFFMENNKILKIIFLLLTLLVGLLLVWQRVHYSIDIIGGWVFAWLVHYIVIRINKRTFSTF